MALSKQPKQKLFASAFDHHTITGHYVAYHLLTVDAPDLPEIRAAGHTQRARDISLGSCVADEWLIRFRDGGLIGWIGKTLGVGPAALPAPPLHEISEDGDHRRPGVFQGTERRIGRPGHQPPLQSTGQVPEGESASPISLAYLKSRQP
jgi:hypothetical protein